MVNNMIAFQEKAAKALFALTEDLKDVAGTPFEHFRKGRNWKANQPILMRFATTEDKKGMSITFHPHLTCLLNSVSFKIIQ